MTLREAVPQGSGPVLVVVASSADADALAPLGRDDGAGAAAELVATGPSPMEVDLALDDRGAPASRVLLVDVPPGGGPAAQLAALLPRLDELVGESAARGIVVRGGTPAALAAAQAATWRAVPLVHLADPTATGADAATQAACAALALWPTGTGGRAGAGGPAEELARRVYGALVPTRAPRLVPLEATGPIPTPPLTA